MLVDSDQAKDVADQLKLSNTLEVEAAFDRIDIYAPPPVPLPGGDVQSLSNRDLTPTASDDMDKSLLEQSLREEISRVCKRHNVRVDHIDIREGDKNSLDNADTLVVSEISVCVDPEVGNLTQYAIPTELPDAAPELYKDAPKNETIVEFLRRVWLPWISERLLTTADLKHLDPSAYTAVYNWRTPEGLPEDIRLPTKRRCGNRHAPRAPDFFV